jgi:cytochrome b
MPRPARIDRRSINRPDAHRSPEMVRVWDLFVRTFHWTLALSFVIAWFTAHSAERMHHWAGYVAAALVIMRAMWGVLGTPYARFSQFVRSPMTSARYLLDILAGREARFVGHNPAGGVMVLTLMTAMAVTALTGWMMTTATWFGVDWVESAHSISAHGLLLLIFMHLGGVALASVRHRENLVGAMITGRKRKPGIQDVT